jgi:hypothetical protein
MNRLTKKQREFLLELGMHRLGDFQPEHRLIHFFIDDLKLRGEFTR